MTTTDEARVTDEEIAQFVSAARDAQRERNRSGWTSATQSTAIVALADRLAARDAERTEMVALLETLRRMAADPMKSMDAGRVIDANRVDELCEDMLAKLRTP